jgi:F-type H+-transporting ATPase subunit a
MEDAYIVFSFFGIGITSTVVTTWGVMIFLILISLLVVSRLQVDSPGVLQICAEAIVEAIERTVREMAPGANGGIISFVGTLWIFIGVSNLVGIIPELHSPTGDLSLTAALAICVFFSTHWFGCKAQGLVNYLKEYFRPNPILFPFHVIAELSRTLALAVRLFGNIASLELAALLVVLVAGFLVPIPLLMLHVVEAVVQAYIFGILAMVYIGGATTSHALKEHQAAVTLVGSDEKDSAPDEDYSTNK